MIPEYHPYCSVYTTKPKLYKFGHDFGNGYYDKLIFQKDPNYNEYIKQKHAIKHNPINRDYGYSNEINEVLDFVFKKTYYAKWNGYLIQDDFTIHKVENGTDKLIYTDVSFPSLWNPSESLGNSLLTFHEPVPKLVLPQKVLESCIKNRYVRFVWSIFYSDRLNQHPDLPLEKFNPNKPDWFLRVERQVIWGFPELSCFLFVIKPFIVRNPKVPELLNTISGMTQEFKDYKRITPGFEEYLNMVGDVDSDT